MEETLESTDRAITLYVNHFGSPWLDEFMTAWSSRWIWMPLYALLLGLLFRRFARREFILILVSVLVLIVAADQTASSLFKPLFERLRPCHDPQMLTVLRVPDGCGGLYGFASSHAANTMALAVFFALFPQTIKVRMLASALFVWAVISGWSRIYLGMHFMGDVVCGFAIGAFWAAVVHLGLRKYVFIAEKITSR